MRIEVFSRKQEELSVLRQRFARLTLQNLQWEDCELSGTTELAIWSQRTGSPTQSDALICDVDTHSAVDALITARQQNPDSLVVPIAGATVLPMTYVRPEIMPCALLWRPLESESTDSVLTQLLQLLHERNPNPSQQECMEIKTRQKTYYLPYSDIYYLEARDKKLFLRLQYEEIMFRGTLGQLESRLPDCFVRCHKSYLVNTAHIASINHSEQLIELEGGMWLPISRGYRDRLKGAAHES